MTLLVKKVTTTIGSFEVVLKPTCDIYEAIDCWSIIFIISNFISILGTGKWTAISALDCGMPVTLIGESVFARCLSSLKDERVKASKVLKGPKKACFEGDANNFVEDIRQALYASKIVSYAQGFMLLRQAAKV